jgi:periplasmic protein TonB
MGFMSGAASAPAPLEPRPPLPEPEGDLFSTALVVSNPKKERSPLGARVSLVLHVVILSLIVFVPIFWPEALPEHTDYVRALLYDPPPPPPPPLPKGSNLVQKAEPAKPVTPDKPEVKKPEFVEPVQPKPEERPLVAENRPPETEQFGSDQGSDIGVAEGMEVGVEGGVVGGTPGGVLGGVIGGTGTGPVLDYDQPPRPIKLTKPQYPQEAFIKKIEGTVIVEILIDSTGRVIRARVIQSVPMLDAAAVRTVYEWVFSPAMKHGRPVATIANAPVAFRIF